jgi:hypothetical protein
MAIKRTAGRVVRALVMTLVVTTGIAATAIPAKDIVHITGNLSKLSADAVTVSIDTNSVDVVLTPATKYFLGARPGKREDMLVGDTVDVSALKVDGKWQADRVKYMHPKK